MNKMFVDILELFTAWLTLLSAFLVLCGYLLISGDGDLESCMAWIVDVSVLTWLIVCLYIGIAYRKTIKEYIRINDS